MTLPRAEVDFDSVPSEELWACVIWEYGRTVKWIHKLLPDYGSPASIRNRLPGLMDPSLPVALRYLHRMLCVAAQNTNDLKTAERIVSMTHQDVIRKAQAIDRIEQLADGSMSDSEKWKILDLVGRLSSSDAVDLADALHVAPLRSLDKLLQQFETKARVEKHLSPFPSTSWVSLGQEIREEIVSALLEEPGTTVDFPRDESEPSPGLYQALQKHIEDKRKERTKSCDEIPPLAHRFVPGSALSDISSEVLGLGIEAGLAISSLRSDIAVTQGLGAVVLRVNWKASNEELENLFRQWLKSRPKPFESYAKGKSHSVFGPAGLELPVKPSTALESLGSWRKAEVFGEGAGWLEEVVAAYEPASEGKGYTSYKKAYSRGRKVAQQVMDYLFPKVVQR